MINSCLYELRYPIDFLLHDKYKFSGEMRNFRKHANVMLLNQNPTDRK